MAVVLLPPEMRFVGFTSGRRRLACFQWLQPASAEETQLSSTCDWATSKWSRYLPGLHRDLRTSKRCVCVCVCGFFPPCEPWADLSVTSLLKTRGSESGVQMNSGLCAGRDTAEGK